MGEPDDMDLLGYVSHHRSARAAAVGLAAVGLVASLSLGPGGSPPASGTASFVSTTTHHGVSPLPLGPPGLPETRTTTTLERGVTWTHIERGATSPDVRWVVELSIPSSESSPDPDAPPRAVQDRTAADALVAQLAAAGVSSQAQPVEQPATADVPAGVIGYRVRLAATYASKAEADAQVATLRGQGFTSRSWYAGWDGGNQAAGHWSLEVLTIDPHRFRGDLRSTYGPDIEKRETTSALAAYEHAAAAVNAGFFVLDPAAGAEGDPAGAGVYDGSLASEPVGRRPVLVLREDARSTQITRPVWRGTVRLARGTALLDGLNRVPGLIRNCGGVGDSPTDHPLHDITCTDAGELVAFDTQFGARTPGGPGREVVTDRHGRVMAIADVRGTALKPGQQSLQATGDRVPELAGLVVGDRLDLRTHLYSGKGQRLDRPGVSVVNGGPLLLAHGRERITQAADGMVRPGDPSFAYGWVLQRNPRTFAGVDRQGRTVLVTVDGRQLDQNGLSIPETADVARALGLVDAVNLDGGGSTAAVVDDSVVSHPSDATGERPVGDAIVIR
ncbi:MULTISPECIES: phosphodiester glycosidase family protein [unclassified Nocardioides]|uniref:phosphodiester glycosidase family protein n=1 Tax=unclassified Nocardioides TaxID=2615069 RepID=UPI00361D0828